jgi:hypothetical protein
MTKPLKFHQTLNLPPRSHARGKNRRSDPSSHRRSVERTDFSPGGADAGTDDRSGWITWTTIGGSSVTWSAFDFANCNPKPPAIPYAGIRTGEIIGHRLWWVMPGNELCSLAHHRIWQPGETIHGDLEELVAGPVEPIWGGTYAFSDAKHLGPEIAECQKACVLARKGLAFVFGWDPYCQTSTLVSGTIKMWGEVVEHETGWRSQFAKINSIDSIFGPGNIDALRAKYLVRS